MWTQAHQNVLNAYHAKFGLPTLDNDVAREWTFKLGQQFNFSFPTEGWSTKRASLSRPPSTDVICTKSPFVGYDVIVSQGSPSQALNNLVGHHGEDLTGQVVIETPAVNHIGTSGGGTTPPPVTDCSKCEKELADLKANSVRKVGYDEAKSVEFGLACNDVYTESGAPKDAGMISVHSQRAMHDYYMEGLSWPDSKKKHINGIRGEYGLPPI